MATTVRAPHINRTHSGVNNYDPLHGSIFQVTFGTVEGIQSSNDVVELLPDQILSISGLDALQKTVSAGEQKFLGASASYLNPVLDNTYADLTLEFNLNIRNVKDVFVLRFFKEWEKCGYNLMNGHRMLMQDYIMNELKIDEANRNGDVWRTITFHRVMLTGVTGHDALNYTDNEAKKLSVTLRADYWEEDYTLQESTATPTENALHFTEKPGLFTAK